MDRGGAQLVAACGYHRVMTGRRFARTDQSVVAQWWWTIDRWTLLAVGVLIGFGSLMVMAASPAVAVRIGAYSLFFVRHYFAVLPATLLTMFAVSLQTPRGIRRLAAALFVVVAFAADWSTMGACQLPESTSAATMAMASGLTSTFPAPIVSAARPASPLATGSKRRSQGALAIAIVFSSSNQCARITLRSHALNVKPAGWSGSSTVSATN